MTNSDCTISCLHPLLLVRILRLLILHSFAVSIVAIVILGIVHGDKDNGTQDDRTSSMLCAVYDCPLPPDYTKSMRIESSGRPSRW